MGPGRLAGDRLDARSDIYSLGLVAFNCLTGTLPFPSKSAQEAMIMRLTDQPKKLADMKPEVSWPAELQRVMDKALARDSVDRYSTAPEFGRDIAKAVENMPATIVAEMGTMVVGAAPVPATRVASADKGAATVVAGAPVSGAVAPTSGKKMSPAVIGGGVVLVAGLAFLAFKLTSGDPTTPSTAGADTTGNKPAATATTPPPETTPAAGTNTVPAGGPTANNKGAPNPKADPKQTAANPKLEKGKQAPAPGGAQPPSAPPAGAQQPPTQPQPQPQTNVLPDFVALADSLSLGRIPDARAGRVGAQMTTLIPSLSGESLGGAYAVQALAFVATGRDKDACGAARRAKDHLRNAKLLTFMNTLLGDDACQ